MKKNHLIAAHYTVGTDLNPLNAEHYASESFALLNQQAARLNIQVDNHYRVTDKLVQEIIHFVRNEHPDMLLLDEVMAGLNPTETDEAVELIRKINENGTTILLIEHVMRAVANLCQKVVVMHHGEKITEGTPEMVMNDPYVIEIYLGKEEH